MNPRCLVTKPTRDHAILLATLWRKKSSMMAVKINAFQFSSPCFFHSVPPFLLLSSSSVFFALHASSASRVQWPSRARACPRRARKKVKRLQAAFDKFAIRPADAPFLNRRTHIRDGPDIDSASRVHPFGQTMDVFAGDVRPRSRCQKMVRRRG